MHIWQEREEAKATRVRSPNSQTTETQTDPAAAGKTHQRLKTEHVSFKTRILIKKTGGKRAFQK